MPPKRTSPGRKPKKKPARAATERRSLLDRPPRTSSDERERTALSLLAEVARLGGAGAGELAHRGAEKRLEWFVRKLGHDLIKYVGHLHYTGKALRDEALRTPADAAAIDARFRALHGAIETLSRLADRSREAVSLHSVHFNEEPLAALLEEARAAVVEQLPARAARIALVVDVEEGLGAHVDHYRFLPALVDLIRNAAESYAEDAGRMEVTATARSRERGRVVEIAIADRGCGIHAESFPHLYSVFSTSKLGASGVGLYIVRRVVEDVHGGRLVVESTRGEGTVVRVLVPRKQADVMPRRRLTTDEMFDEQARREWEAEMLAAKKKNAARARRA
jgi:signal transduction histidine kinase